ncbi:hypothetical protein QL285_010651 [Trifolium repens]|nr:hypothetical protein QL285_010651 [Trifolium repens]
MVPLMSWEVSSDKPCLLNSHVGMLAHFVTFTASQMVSIHPNGFSTNLWDTVGESSDEEPDWDYLFEHDYQDIYNSKSAYTGDEDEKDEDEEEGLFSAWKRPVVVADPNFDPPSLTPPKKRSNMSIEDRFFDELSAIGRDTNEKNTVTFFRCNGVHCIYHARIAAEKRSKRSAQIDLQKKMKMDRLSGKSKNVSSESGCSH